MLIYVYMCVIILHINNIICLYKYNCYFPLALGWIVCSYMFLLIYYKEMGVYISKIKISEIMDFKKMI